MRPGAKQMGGAGDTTPPMSSLSEIVGSVGDVCLRRRYCLE